MNSGAKHVGGMDGISASLRAYPEAMRSQILGTAVGRAARPVRQAAKRFAQSSRRTGALQESISVVVREYENRGKAVAVVGPSKDSFKAGKKVGKKDSKQGADKPHKYAHLIEFGHVARNSSNNTGTFKKTSARDRKRAFGEILPSVRKTTTFVAARPFMRPAIISTAGRVQSDILLGVKQGMSRVRTKVIKQGHTA